MVVHPMIRQITAHLRMPLPPQPSGGGRSVRGYRNDLRALPGARTDAVLSAWTGLEQRACKAKRRAWGLDDATLYDARTQTHEAIHALLTARIPRAVLRRVDARHRHQMRSHE